MQENFQYLIYILLGILSLASLTGFILDKKTPEGTPKKSVINNLIQRINSWWLMVFVLGVAFFLGTTTTLLLFNIFSFLALREFLTLTPTRKGDHKALAAAFLVVLPIQYCLIGIEWYGLFSIFIPVYCFLLLPIFSTISGDTNDFMERIAKIQFGIMISIYCLSHAPALLTLDITNYPKENNIMLLFYFIFVAQLSDVLQYVFGKLFGKHKIAPIVSPSKTVEGFIGGALSASLVGANLYWITPFSFWQSLGMSTVIVIMGFFGGLVLSAVKRSLGAKDWGDLIQGHGGIMDRLDSICFSAPIFFHFVRYFFTT